MIWRYWPGGPLPASEPIAHASLISLSHPPTDLTDSDLGADVVAWLDAGAAQVCPEDRSRHRSHMVRWRVLHDYGGVWLDHGVMLLRPLPAYPFAASHEGRACTCVVGLPTGHALASAMLAWIAAAPASDACSADVSGWRAFSGVLPGVSLQPMAPEPDGLGLHVFTDQACSAVRRGNGVPAGA